MRIKRVEGRHTTDSRGERTVEVFIETSVGNFSSSSPSGKSTGKFETPCYKKSLEGDIETLNKFSDYFSEEDLEKFEDLEKVEEIIKDRVGANTLFAFESAVLKAIAKERGKQVWEIVNESFNGKGVKISNFPRLVGNCVGGGKHSGLNKKPDFQEFLLIPDSTSVLQSVNV